MKYSALAVCCSIYEDAATYCICLTREEFKSIARRTPSTSTGARREAPVRTASWLGEETKQLEWIVEGDYAIRQQDVLLNHEIQEINMANYTYNQRRDRWVIVATVHGVGREPCDWPDDKSLVIPANVMKVCEDIQQELLHTLQQFLECTGVIARRQRLFQCIKVCQTIVETLADAKGAVRNKNDVVD